MADQPLPVEFFRHDIARADQRGPLHAVRLHLAANRIGDVDDRRIHPALHFFIDAVHAVGADQQRLCPGLLQSAGRCRQHFRSMRPLLLRGGAADVGEVETFDQQRRAVLPALRAVHRLIDDLIITCRRCPAETADQAELLHGAPYPNCRPGVPRRLSPSALRTGLRVGKPLPARATA